MRYRARESNPAASVCRTVGLPRDRARRSSLRTDSNRRDRAYGARLHPVRAAIVLSARIELATRASDARMISASPRERGVPGRSRTSDARFVASHDVHFNTGTESEPSAGIEPASPPYRSGALPLSDDGIALAGFEPASIHAKRPIGKRASHAQPLGHATVHPQPRSQPTPPRDRLEVAGHGRRFHGSGFTFFR